MAKFPYSAAARELAECFERIESDVYGNPRYYIPRFLLPAAIKAKRLAYGLTMYRGKRCGPGYVITSYNLESDCENMLSNCEESKE